MDIYYEDSQSSQSSQCTTLKRALHDSKFWAIVAVVIYVAFAGYLLTNFAINTDFYKNLIQPSWAPTARVISIVWTVLFVLIAIATYMAYLEASPQEREILLWLFGIQIALNLLWVIVFFGTQNPNKARIVIVLLLIAIAVQGFYMSRISSSAAALFIPYFIWVCIATALNFQIVTLNNL